MEKYYLVYVLKVCDQVYQSLNQYRKIHPHTKEHRFYYPHNDHFVQPILQNRFQKNLLKHSQEHSQSWLPF